MPLNIAVGITVTLIFAMVAVFAQRWRLGFGILGAGMLLVAAPWFVAGLRMDAPAAEIAWRVLKAWRQDFPLFALIFLPLAWVARWLWEDLGQAFEVILDRWGIRGAVTFIVIIMAGYAVHLVFWPH